MANISYVTEEGFQRLKEELEQLEAIERPALSKLIADARDKGDLSENAEYEAAKDAQGMLEMKIAKLKNILARTRVVDKSKISTTTVQILNKVELKNKNNNTSMEYTIVAESEANIKAKKISVNTPIAMAILGKKVGDVVEVKVPSGVIPFEIVNISR